MIFSWKIGKFSPLNFTFRVGVRIFVIWFISLLSVGKWKFYLTLINVGCCCLFYTFYCVCVCVWVSVAWKFCLPCTMRVDFWGHCRHRPTNSVNDLIDITRPSATINLWSCLVLELEERNRKSININCVKANSRRIFLLCLVFLIKIQWRIYFFIWIFLIGSK